MSRKREKHNMTDSPEYYVWYSMRQRCSNPNNIGYKTYGAKGIKVCKRWDNSFKKFYKDMGNRPTPKHTLDRINSKKNYTPKNCRWATMKVQQNNRTNNRLITAKGQSLNLIQWAEKTGIDFRTIHNRLKKGWKTEEALGLIPRVVKRDCLYCSNPFIAVKRQLYCDVKCHNDAAYVRTKAKLQVA